MYNIAVTAMESYGEAIEILWGIFFINTYKHMPSSKGPTIWKLWLIMLSYELNFENLFLPISPKID